MKSVVDNFDVAAFVTFIAPFCISNIFAKKQNQPPTAKESERMSKIEKVKIPVSLLSELYKNVLIDDALPNESPVKKQLNAVIAVADSNHKQHAEADELLSGIMNACKLNIGNSVVLKKDNSSTINSTAIKENYITRTVILFGITPTEFGLPITFPHFQIQQVDEIKYISSPSLEEMLKDKTLKVKLWNSLKQIFV